MTTNLVDLPHVKENEDLKLLHNLVAILPDEIEETETGIKLPTSQATATGTVVAVGPGIYLPSGDFVETTVKKGDKVVYVKGKGEEIVYHGKKILVTLETNLVGIITKVNE